jgi:hypothetical protein
VGSGGDRTLEHFYGVGMGGINNCLDRVSLAKLRHFVPCHGSPLDSQPGIICVSTQDVGSGDSNYMTVTIRVRGKPEFSNNRSIVALSSVPPINQRQSCLAAPEIPQISKFPN